MAVQLVTKLGTEPIDHADARHHARVIGTGDDVYLTDLIAAAREYCEASTNRALVSATYKQVFAGFPSCGELRLDRPPLVSVDSIQYVGADGSVATLAAETYEVSTVGDPGRVVLASGQSWPSVQSDAVEPVTVNFTAGYAEAPERIKHALRLLVAHWYEHREAVTSGKAPSTVPMALDALLASARWEAYR